MKIIISEQQLIELFDKTNIYPIILSDTKTYTDAISYRYTFTSKDNIRYIIGLVVYTDNKTGKLDFLSSDLNSIHRNYNSNELINKYDAIKVFNTMKYIINHHRKEFTKLIVSSTEDRSKFYEKLLTYMNVPFKRKNENELIADV